MEDLPAWHFDAKGLFMAKSGYKAEMIAALRGVQQAARMGMQQIILETDASVLHLPSVQQE
ncbi:hypothetical protein C2845_PM02G17340 [Panicum miliaceum]|uniref:RNase H type-1 domain-containing protein n=1 Tax=Panicum miliaceum TaxID=4540 RepID=A0A3L6SD24_PANMI|nr:hypothetical protein C2845_PM02G17340 [Panicum miliaceum]